jgi:hypothetical protein
MSNINITITLDKEDRKSLDALTSSITLLASVLGNAQPKEVQEKIIAEVHNGLAPVAEPTTPAPVEEPVGETPAPVEEPVGETPAPVAETTPEVKPVSLAEFQKAVTLAVSKGPEAKEAVKTIINKYAASVSAVPEGKRADIIAELSQI